jgi:hypothetical protein
MTMGITADLHCQGPKPAVMGGLEPAANTYYVVMISQVRQRALAQESQIKDPKLKPNHPGMHMLTCYFDCSDDEGKYVFVAKFAVF